MMHVIITGAGGLIATELAFDLLRNTDTHLYLLTTHIDKIEKRYNIFQDRVECFTLESFSAFMATATIKFDCCIHTAFARDIKGSLIVESISYLRSLLKVLRNANISVFANISSQSVYGKVSAPLWKENTLLDPDYLYAMGKYFSEVLIESMLEDSGIKWTNLRLCSVCEKARFIRVFVQNAIDCKPIILTTPDQQCSFIEVQDAADALMAFIKQSENTELKPVYNLGANIVDTIKGIALLVKKIGEDRYGLENVQIVEMPSDNHIRMGMDSSMFMETFGWQPKRNMQDMVMSMFEMQMGREAIPISFKLVYGL